MTAIFLAGLIFAGAGWAAPDEDGKTSVNEQITVKSHTNLGPLPVPPPSPTKALIDDVLSTLSFSKEKSSVETVRVSPDVSRLALPFPDPPFLAFSPENIQANYDSWTFVVLNESEKPVWTSEGTGHLRDQVEWDGRGHDGRIALVPGHSYRYRFTGVRGSKKFRVESERIQFRSFSRPEVVGQKLYCVWSDVLFEANSDQLGPDAGTYLDAMLDAWRASGQPAGTIYRGDFHFLTSRSLAAARLAELRKHISDGLLVPPARIQIDLAPGPGDFLSVDIAPPEGATLRIE